MIPDPAVVLSLEPEELAGVLLEHLNSLPANDLLQLYGAIITFFYSGQPATPCPDSDALCRAAVLLLRPERVVRRCSECSW